MDWRDEENRYHHQCCFSIPWGRPVPRGGILNYSIADERVWMGGFPDFKHSGLRNRPLPATLMWAPRTLSFMEKSLLRRPVQRVQRVPMTITKSAAPIGIV